MAVLRQPDWPAALAPALLQAGLQSKGALAWTAAAHRPGVPPATLSSWQQHPYFPLRNASYQYPQAPLPADVPAAQRRDLPPTVLRMLLACQEGTVRSALARNPALPLDTLRQLAQSPVEAVRKAAAYNPHTPPALLTALAQDRSAPVRTAAAQHPPLPAAALPGLAQDKAIEVLQVWLSVRICQLRWWRRY